MTKRRRTTDSEVVREIERLAVQEERGATEIYRLLERDPGFRDRLPTLRTVQNIVRDAAVPHDPSAEWSLFTGNEEDTAAVLECLSVSIQRNPGRWITLRFAEVVGRVWRAVPDDTPLAFKVNVARRLFVAQLRDEDTRPLESLLVFTPWRDGGKAYAEAWRRGWVIGDYLDYPGSYVDVEKPEDAVPYGSDWQRSS